ncbi:MAG: hypothetical protein AAF490_10005 [Chloroflexota bacterium]
MQFKSILQYHQMTPNLLSNLALANHKALLAYLHRFDESMGVLDYIPFLLSETPSVEAHRKLALDGMDIIAQSLDQWADKHATLSRPIEQFFRIEQDETKLTGQAISFREFWGSNRVEKKMMGPNSWSIPNVDGYKRAFFLPPYSLSGWEDFDQLFEEINFLLFGIEPERWIIYQWSTNWSNYFEAGHEWWGAFYWTVYSPETNFLTVIGASATD